MQFRAIGGTPSGGANRRALSVEDRCARALLTDLALARGFSVHQDPMAHLFTRRAGPRADAPAVLMGMQTFNSTLRI